MISFDLTHRVARGTGANTGIGQAIALALAGAGADLLAIGRSSCAETVAQVEKLGRRALYLHADLATIEPAEGLITEAVAAFGQLDILVNNAGIIRRDDAVAFSEADWDAVVDTNQRSRCSSCARLRPGTCCRAAAARSSISLRC
jgi:2-deoxy-D-gluconate 3-dehydrogenase